MENPALKLHSILNQVYTECSSYHSPPKFEKTWGKIFELDPKDLSNILTSLNALFNLFHETKQYIVNHEKLNIDENLGYLNRIQRAIFSLDFEGSMSGFMSNMDKETLMALFFIGKQVDLVYALNESNINGEEISNLIQDVDMLTESIINSTLPKDVISLLIKNLDLIRSSLTSYKIFGTEGMKNALEQTIGSLFVNNEVITPVAQDENIKGVFNIIDKMNTVLSTGVAIKDLLGPIMGLLLK
ncbi:MULTISPECIES: hypothetical protein [Bacillus cereus group]|uniref:hypothetical protein n=1 Tax=Bacillus cereus group TaxID=86661 RepID=UPI000BFB3953|nr:MULTISPECIES: hypothetical protein [Bacillus cereus group]PGQ44350.1 hypothetical protein COA20_31190 [Bacillus thuringiensis]PGV71867.1 hypothetical protein COD84_24265 [Bacillus cereus]